MWTVSPYAGSGLASLCSLADCSCLLAPGVHRLFASYTFPSFAPASVMSAPVLQAGSSTSLCLILCRDELHEILKEEKLVGATLLILANKQDLHGALPAAKIKEVDSPQSSSVHPALSAS